MFRVMVVEDEPPIMRMIKAGIEAADSDFEVKSCCMNGQEAVETLKSDDYDIVFTDIKMPVMTGIELAGWIYENKPQTMVVILSGYSDFEYARQALTYKVFDYLLKPVSKDKLRELIERIRSELKKKGEPPRDDDRSAVVILACAGAYLLYGSEVMLPGETFWTDERIEGFMQRTLKGNEGYIFFNSNSPSERFVVVDSDSAERQTEIVNMLYNSFSDSELPVTVVYKRDVILKDAGKSFAELREHLIRLLVLDRGQLICCNDTREGYESIDQPYSKRDIDELAAAVKNGSMNDVRKRFSDILDEMRAKSYTQEEINGFLNVVLDTYALNYPTGIQRKNTSVKREFVNALAGFTSYENLLDDIVSILMTLKSDVKSQDRYSRLADDVEQYLIANYNKELSSKVLAREFGFVPSYISRIFKRQKGLSPNEYITKYRIETAKTIISENPEMQIKEVAGMVGFKDAYYFSKTFKRETGIWPTEHR